MTITVDSHDTGGAYAVVDSALPAGQSGPPLHVHPTSDEVFTVLTGTLLLHVGGELMRAAAGQVVHVRRGTPHTFATGPNESARFVTVHNPGGFEGFHRDAAAAAERAGRTLTVPELSEIARRYDWTPAGPPLLPTGELAQSRPANAER
jgi:quercetin dioxygenase-like cupin family protein